MRKLGHVAQFKKKENSDENLVGKLEGRDYSRLRTIQVKLNALTGLT